ncbi:MULTISPECIES: hypothetical protein [unclassified Micromonospora]|uniref:hypothetical protein n=1 Tax=unclassified Micromonospora TaxID=2617518 RepID=UPI001C6071F0|nr:hypothetical protein [Micromonospora sp. RL09-050-HVF-A]MBW4702508.1 hypothetical protein [Micromonospora sp. RL09-050-HVF-A]
MKNYMTAGIRRQLGRAAVVVMVGAAGLVAATPAHAFPSNCDVWTIYEDGVGIGGATKCASGTGTHRVGIHCSNGQDYYGDGRTRERLRPAFPVGSAPPWVSS